MKALMTKSHLKQNQAQQLLPILAKVKAQKVSAELKVRKASREVSVAEETVRTLKKRKAVVSREDAVLGRAVTAIESGDEKALEKAMGDMGTIRG